MSLRHRLAGYLLALHLAMAGLGVVLFIAHGPWLIAWEVLLLVSLVVGVILFRQLWQPVELAHEGADLIEERDFTSKFVPVGRPEVDALVSIYNRMIDHLREERLRVEEQNCFMEKILASTPSGIITFDLDGRVDIVNRGAERLLRAEAAWLKGRSRTDLGHVLPGVEALAQGQTAVLSLGRRQVRCQLSHFRDRGFARSFLLLDELTDELRRAEKQAHERIIRLLSHEVSNTVGATNSLLHSALKYGRDLAGENRADYEEALRVVISRTEQLNRFMNDFADVVRLPPPRLQPVDLHDLLVRIEQLLRPELRVRRIEWRWQLEDEQMQPVPMDPAQMEQVFLNVLKNAQEAIGEEGCITIRLGREGDRPRVIVEDSGTGITAQARDQLFTPFFSTKENGQGIGLTLVQEVLTRHGFEFALEGEPGAGARFTIVF